MPVIDVSSPGFSPYDTEFKIIQRNDRTGQKKTLDPTAEVLLHHWYPMWLIRSFIMNSNHYRSERKKKFPSYHSWKRTKDSEEVTLSNIFHFLAMLYYMGWDQGNSDSADENIEEGDNSNESRKDSQDKSDTAWYYKLQQLIYHVRDASASLSWSLGTYLSLDEMMMHFMGCSMEMH
eukprot:1050636-Ditylum_brightwellii.AAC.1